MSDWFKLDPLTCLTDIKQNVLMILVTTQRCSTKVKKMTCPRHATYLKEGNFHELEKTQKFWN